MGRYKTLIYYFNEDVYEYAYVCEAGRCEYRPTRLLYPRGTVMVGGEAVGVIEEYDTLKDAINSLGLTIESEVEYPFTVSGVKHSATRLAVNVGDTLGDASYNIRRLKQLLKTMAKPVKPKPPTKPPERKPEEKPAVETGIVHGILLLLIGYLLSRWG